MLEEETYLFYFPESRIENQGDLRWQGALAKAEEETFFWPIFGPPGARYWPNFGVLGGS